MFCLYTRDKLFTLYFVCIQVDRDTLTRYLFCLPYISGPLYFGQLFFYVCLYTNEQGYFGQYFYLVLYTSGQG